MINFFLKCKPKQLSVCLVWYFDRTLLKFLSNVIIILISTVCDLLGGLRIINLLKKKKFICRTQGKSHTHARKHTHAYTENTVSRGKKHSQKSFNTRVKCNTATNGIKICFSDGVCYGLNFTIFFPHIYACVCAYIQHIQAYLTQRNGKIFKRLPKFLLWNKKRFFFFFESKLFDE